MAPEKFREFRETRAWFSLAMLVQSEAYRAHCTKNTSTVLMLYLDLPWFVHKNEIKVQAHANTKPQIKL